MNGEKKPEHSQIIDIEFEHFSNFPTDLSSNKGTHNPKQKCIFHHIQKLFDHISGYSYFLHKLFGSDHRSDFVCNDSKKSSKVAKFFFLEQHHNIFEEVIIE
jgi:hypothetical protein